MWISGVSLVTNPQPPEVLQMREPALDDPALASQPGAVRSAAAGDYGLDAARPQQAGGTCRGHSRGRPSPRSGFWRGLPGLPATGRRAISARTSPSSCPYPASNHPATARSSYRASRAISVTASIGSRSRNPTGEVSIRRSRGGANTQKKGSSETAAPLDSFVYSARVLPCAALPAIRET